MPTAEKPPQVDSLAAALVLLQSALPDVRKGETAKVQTKTGGSYTYSYADLADCTQAIMPKLAEFGLSFSTKPILLFDENRSFVLRYTLRHVSGESDSGDYPLPDPLRSSAQEIGSAITYGRRYVLCAVTGLAPKGDDDDGKAATQSHYDVPDEPPPPDPRTQLFSDVKAAGFAKDMTEQQIADEFAGWSAGTKINAATAAQLTKFVHHLRKPVDADAT